LAAQLQFQRVHAADKLLVHLLDQGGISREPAGVELAHLIDQRLQLLPRLGTILHYGANLVEQVQSLVDLALSIGRVRTLLGRHGLTGDASIAGVIGAIAVAVAIAAATGRIACRTSDAIPDITCQGLPPLATGALATGLTLTTLTGLAAALTASTGLAALLARLPRLPILRLLLTGLASLTGLPVAAELAGPLELLAAGLAGLPLSRLRVRLRVGLRVRSRVRLRAGTPAEAGKLVTHTR